jgi:hypothetical protein
VNETSEIRKGPPNGAMVAEPEIVIGDNLGYAPGIGEQTIDSASTACPPAGAVWKGATYTIRTLQSMSHATINPWL